MMLRRLIEDKRSSRLEWLLKRDPELSQLLEELLELEDDDEQWRLLLFALCSRLLRAFIDEELA